LVNARVEANGVTVDEQVHSYLKDIILSEGEKQLEETRPNTFKRVFWEQQLQAASKEDHRGMRWYPLIIRWCIYLGINLKEHTRPFVDLDARLTITAYSS